MQVLAARNDHCLDDMGAFVRVFSVSRLLSARLAVDGSCSASCAKLVAVECNELEGAAHCISFEQTVR